MAVPRFLFTITLVSSSDSSKTSVHASMKSCGIFIWTNSTDPAPARNTKQHYANADNKIQRLMSRIYTLRKDRSSFFCKLIWSQIRYGQASRDVNSPTGKNPPTGCPERPIFLSDHSMLHVHSIIWETPIWLGNSVRIVTVRPNCRESWRLNERSINDYVTFHYLLAESSHVEICVTQI